MADLRWALLQQSRIPLPTLETTNSRFTTHHSKIMSGCNRLLLPPDETCSKMFSASVLGMPISRK